MKARIPDARPHRGFLLSGTPPVLCRRFAAAEVRTATVIRVFQVDCHGNMADYTFAKRGEECPYTLENDRPAITAIARPLLAPTAGSRRVGSMTEEYPILITRRNSQTPD